MSQDMQTCITPVDMLHKDSMQPHGRKGFDRYARAVACVDSYAGAMSGLGESRSDSSDRLRVWLIDRMHRSASSSAASQVRSASQVGASTNSEVERIFGRLDNLTRRKRNPSSWAAGQVTTAVISKPRSDPENLASLEATIQYLYPHALHRLAHHAIHRPAPNCPTLVVLAPRTLATSMSTRTTAHLNPKWCCIWWPPCPPLPIPTGRGVEGLSKAQSEPLFGLLCHQFRPPGHLVHRGRGGPRRLYSKAGAIKGCNIIIVLTEIKTY